MSTSFENSFNVSSGIKAIVTRAFQDAEKANKHCAITSESRCLNAPYNFVQSSSLIPGRSSHREPILLVQKDRAEGINEIRKNFIDLSEEHCWIFIPQANLWVDDTTTVSEGSVCGDCFMRVTLMRHFPVIELFHTHPDGLYADLHAKGLLPAYHRLISPTPSLGDQFGAAMVEDFAGPTSRMISHILSYYGDTSYLRTQRFREDANIIGSSFDWDLSLVDIDAPFASEITRICAMIEDSVACVQADGSKIPTWQIRFEPFE